MVNIGVGEPYGHWAVFSSLISDVLADVSVKESVVIFGYELEALRQRQGRLFVLGVGGGAANAAHAVNDFRKLCGIEAYAPTDGIAELTARANDEGFDTIFASWLYTSNLCSQDMVFVFSVGGGTPLVSACITNALALAKSRQCRILGVVHNIDGSTAQMADRVIALEYFSSKYEWPKHLKTPITEALQIIVLHALVSLPDLQINETKW